MPVATATATGGEQDSASTVRAAVATLIDRGDAKSAVAKAKAYHKQAPSAASEALLAEAYLTRVLSFPAGMTTEVFSLIDLVKERFPTAREDLDRIRPWILARHGVIDELLRPLAEDGCPDEQRKRIEDAIRREATDLEAIARSGSLPVEHPLRVAAAAAAAAFAGATSGPVRDDEIALPQISRRSPLAPWKLLVKAIAALHRGDRHACERALAALDSESAPARLVPGITALLVDHGGGRPDGDASRELVACVTGRSEPLRRRLHDLDSAFATTNRRKLVRTIREAVRECSRSQPDLLDRLKQLVSVRCAQHEIPAAQTLTAMGGPARHDAAFWRLWARATEDDGQPLLACSLWEEFRRNAINEGWVGVVGPEVASIDLHMIDLLLQLPPETLNDVQRHWERRFPGYASSYENQPEEVQRAAPDRGDPDLSFLHPDRLFQRACASDPQPQHFRRWLDWTRRHDSPKQAEAVALAWHEALPRDSAPLLFLMESSEKRGVLKKALGFLDKAERLESLDPEVRRARVRLMVAIAIRHLAERKLHLARKDLLVLDALPRAGDGSWPVLIAGLRWARSELATAGESTSPFEKVARLLEDELAATVVCLELGKACRLSEKALARLPRPDASTDGGALALATARGCTLGRELGVEIGIPQDWKKRILKALSPGRCDLDPADLLILGEAALDEGNLKLAYAAASCGLAGSEAFAARFLLLRAQSLPESEAERREDCLSAAAVLARRQRDMETVAAIVEAHRMLLAFSVNAPDGTMPPALLEQVLRRERKARGYPRARRVDRDPVFAGACDCPSCRRDRARGGAGAKGSGLPSREQDDAIEDWDFAPDEPYDFDELDGFDGSIPPEFANLPPALRPLLMELLLKHGADGELPTLDELADIDPELFFRMQSAMERHLDSGGIPMPGSRGSNRTKPRKKRKRRKRRGR